MKRVSARAAIGPASKWTNAAGACSPLLVNAAQRLAGSSETAANGSVHFSSRVVLRSPCASQR